MNEPLRDEPIDAFLARQLGAGTDIKPGREARILAEDTALAYMVQHRLDAEPLPDGVVAPITHALPVNLAPIEYVMHIWTHKCTMCNTEHKHSEVFALNHLRSRTGAGNYVRNMSPVARLEWNVPLKVHHVTTRTTAGCFECLDALRSEILPTLPKPPVPMAVLKAEGAAGPARPDSGKKPSGPSGRPLTTDDFMV